MAKSLEKVHLKPGTYTGRWSGYFAVAVDPSDPDAKITKNDPNAFEVNEGVRGINCKCTIVVDDEGYARVN